MLNNINNQSRDDKRGLIFKSWNTRGINNQKRLGKLP